MGPPNEYPLATEWRRKREKEREGDIGWEWTVRKDWVRASSVDGSL